MTTSGTRKLPDYLVPCTCPGAESSGDSPSIKERYLIRAGHSWDDSWELASDIHFEVNSSETELVVVSSLNIQEYGIGDSLESATADMLTSLSDYYQSLESRKTKLAAPAASDLDTLRRLLRPLADDRGGR